nr:putative ribonuclease H-like domain-containing protein [Tanacetum cinerariifolium]
KNSLLLGPPDEHRLRFSKYDSAKELWEAILKTFGGNKATKKTKKNQLKQQYANFKAEGSETLEQTFNRGSKESRVKLIKYGLHFFIKHQQWKSKVPSVQGASTASAQVSTVNIDVAAASLSYDTKKTGKKITIQGSDVAGFNKSKVECFNCHKMGHFARKCKSPKSQDRGKRVSYKKDFKVEEPAPKAMVAIDGIGCDWSYMAEEDEASKNHALVTDEEEVPTEYALMAKSSSSSDNEKDLYWMGLPEFVDDAITDYTRPTPSIDVSKSVSKEHEERWKSNHPSFFEQGGSSGNVVLKPMIKFVKESGCPNATKVNNTENTRKPNVKYAEIPNIPTVGSKVPTAKPAVAADKGNKEKVVKASARWIWKPKQTSSNQGLNFNGGIPHDNIDDKGYWDIGFSRHMTRNISYLSEYDPFNGGYLSFVHGRGKITGKGSIKTGKLEFENVYFMEELKYNLFSVSKICDNKNSVLFTDTECLVLGKDFKLVDDTHVLLRTPRQQNMYTIDLKNVVPRKNLTCLIAKASVDEIMLLHKRLGHLNFKTMHNLVRSNLVKGLPSKSFENDHSCVACLKGKQHKASCKSKLVNSISKPLHTLHMNLFGPTSLSSLNHKWYCLVVTGDFSRFSWTFFLKSKDETSRILRNFITEIENLKDLKVKIIKSDNRGEFRNKEMNEFCSRKGIKREFSNARTPQQNGFLRPFGHHVMILNTLDQLGKFDAKGDESYFVRYSLTSKASMVFNKRTKKIEENLHVDFLENKSIKKGTGPDWLFDIDTLTNSMNYVPVVVVGTSSTNISGTKKDVHQAAAKKDDAILDINSSQKEQQEVNGDKEVSDNSRNSNPTASSKVSANDSFELASGLTVETEVPTVSSPVPTDSLSVSLVTSSVPRIISRGGSSFQEPLSLGNAMLVENRLEYFFEDTSNTVSLNEVEADLSNMETAIQVSPTPTLRIHKDHQKSQIIGPVDTPVQTRHKTKDVDEQSFIATIHQKTNPDLLQYCLFSCFLSQEEPKKIVDDLKDLSWVEAIQQELLQFKIQNVWVLVDCPNRVRPIGMKWVLKNKKDERGIVIRNKARLVAQGHTHEE